MAANARAFGYCFNPISVFWCHRRNGELAGVVVEVHNTYGDRHAYLVHPDEQGRARTEKQMYVSPFHGTDGHYEIAVPPPGDRLHVSVTLHSDDGAVFSASLDGRPTTASPLRSAPAALRGALLIRAHGIWLWARRLGIRPRPAPPTTGRRLMMTTTPSARPPRGPDSAQRPLRPQGRGLRPDRAPAVPRRRTPAARLGPRRHATPRALAAADPSMVIHRPDGVLRRIGRDGLIGFGESYHDRRLGAPTTSAAS